MEWTYIAGVLGAIVLITNAAVALYKWVSPALKAKKTLEDHEYRLTKCEKRENRTDETLDKIQEYNRSQTRAVLSMVNHSIDGNGIDKLQESRDELTELLCRLK